MASLDWIPWLRRIRLTEADEIEIMRRLLEEGITDAMSLKGIAAGLTGKELADAARKEKLAVLDEYLNKKRGRS